MLDLNTYVLNELMHEHQEEIRKSVQAHHLGRAVRSGVIQREKKVSLRKRIGLGMISLGEELAGVKAQQRVPLH